MDSHARAQSTRMHGVVACSTAPSNISMPHGQAAAPHHQGQGGVLALDRVQLKQAVSASVTAMKAVSALAEPDKKGVIHLGESCSSIEMRLMRA